MDGHIDYIKSHPGNDISYYVRDNPIKKDLIELAKYKKKYYLIQK